MSLIQNGNYITILYRPLSRILKTISWLNHLFGWYPS